MKIKYEVSLVYALNYRSNQFFIIYPDLVPASLDEEGESQVEESIADGLLATSFLLFNFLAVIKK
jgi:hypothetical protein